MSLAVGFVFDLFGYKQFMVACSTHVSGFVYFVDMCQPSETNPDQPYPTQDNCLSLLALLCAFQSGQPL